MNRCKPLLQTSSLPRPPSRWALSAALALSVASLTALTALVSPAVAQVVAREFPAKAIRGTLTVTNPPEVLLDGQPARLSPGARIRDPQNMLVMSGSIVGMALLVNFTRESSGLIHEVWLLSPQEAALKRNLATPERNFLFSSETVSGPRDDGKTPFNQLPKFPQQ